MHLLSLSFFPGKPGLLKATLCIAFIAGLLLSTPLWTGERYFPLTSILALPELPQIISVSLFVLMIFLLVVIALYGNRQLLLIFFILLLTAGLYDMNRWQPWCYQYALMLYLFFFYKRKKGAANDEAIEDSFRLIVCGVYFWSGAQKLNPEFFKSTSFWLTEPLENYFGKDFAHSAGYAAWGIPFCELFFSFGLMMYRTRKIAVFLAIAMHCYIILLMTPLGRNYNYVIIPWNLASVTFLLLLFRLPDFSVKRIFSFAAKKFVLPVFILVWVMPFLSLFGKWDAYLSASLYSGNSNKGYIYFSQKIKTALPPEVRKMVHMLNDTLPYLYINEWSMGVLHVPAYPELPVFRSAKNYLLQFASDSSEIVLLVQRKQTLLRESYIERIP